MKKSLIGLLFTVVLIGSSCEKDESLNTKENLQNADRSSA